MGFILLEWNTVSWAFNYRTIGALTHDFFNPYEATPATIANDTSVAYAAGEQGVKTPEMYPYSAKNNLLEIPVLGITAPVIISQSTNVDLLEKDLKNGVIYYPGSVAPSKPGSTVILGHSAPPNWPHINYDWVFSEINDLESGDSIILYFNNTEYQYQVIEKKIVTTEEEISSRTLNGKNNVLTIISCWPPGKNYKRIAVMAELMKNE